MQANVKAKSQYGIGHAVVSGHHLATLAAQETMARGGTLVDAMICASAVLTVVLPHASSLGGCGMMLYFDACTGTVHALNGSGRAPSAATPERFGKDIPPRGPLASVTPTIVRLWARAHERFGRLPWPSLLSAAIRHARDGIGFSEEVARNLRSANAAVTAQPGFLKTFAPNGRLLRAGEPFQQPRLANVLEAIASHGEYGFYDGWVADSLVDFSGKHGGLLLQADLDSTSADWYDTWHVDYRGHRVHVMPPNSVGVLMLRQLELESVSGTAEAMNPMNTAAQVRRAATIIDTYRHRVGDPVRTPQRPADFGLGTTSPMRGSPTGSHTHGVGDTTGFVAVDAQGNGISMLQSVFQPFGSGCLDLNTGVLLNNRLYDFTLLPGVPNTLSPGCRPSHTLNPYLVTEDGCLRMGGISPGGVSQTTTGFQMVTAALGVEESLGDIVSRPRWSLGRDGTVLLEPGIPGTIARALRDVGLHVIENSEHEFYFGSAKLIRISEAGMREAAADLRRQAHAAAW